MLEKLRAKNVLVVTKLDRLGGDAADVLTIVRLLADMQVGGCHPPAQ